MKMTGTFPTLVIDPGDSDDVFLAVSNWLARHGIKVSPAGIGQGVSIRCDVDGRRIGVLCECENCTSIGLPVWWFQLESAPLPWPELVSSQEGP